LCLLNFTKYCLGHILRDFFTNASGHPGPRESLWFGRKGDDGFAARTIFDCMKQSVTKYRGHVFQHYVVRPLLGWALTHEGAGRGANTLYT
jgi:hypothetical protein